MSEIPKIAAYESNELISSLEKSSCLRMSEIMERRVTLIENLNRNRQSLPFEAIYFITANEESINRPGIHGRRP